MNLFAEFHPILLPVLVKQTHLFWQVAYLVEIAHQYWHYLLHERPGFCFSPFFYPVWFIPQLFGGRLRKPVKLLFIKGEFQMWVLNATKTQVANNNRTGKSSLLQLPMTFLAQRPFILPLCGYNLCPSNLYQLYTTKCWNHWEKHTAGKTYYFLKLMEPKRNSFPPHPPECLCFPSSVDVFSGCCQPSLTCFLIPSCLILSHAKRWPNRSYRFTGFWSLYSLPANLIISNLDLYQKAILCPPHSKFNISATWCVKVENPNSLPAALKQHMLPSSFLFLPISPP